MGQDTEQLSREIAGTRRDLAQDVDALQSRISPHAIVERRKAAARNRIHNMRDRVMGTVQSAQSGASQAAGGVSGGASQAATAVTDTAQQAVGKAEQSVEGSPLAAGLVAFGAGMVVSALFPPTAMETQRTQQLLDVAKEQGQPLLEEARSVGQEIGQQVKENASQAAEEVKSTATQAVENLKQEGQSSAQTVQDEVKDQNGSTGQVG